jgi:hypothetical protein
MTKTSIRLLFLAMLIGGTSACGDDGSPAGDSSITVDGGGDTGSGGDSSAVDDGGGDGAVVDSGAADGNVGDAAAGCVATGCPAGQECCSGVPYPAEGVCAEMCTMRSDRHAKESFEAVDADEMLERVAGLSIQEWSYRDESTDVRHVGPMAQDFHRTFGLGDDDRVIHPVDATGVSLAAIQALTRRVEDLERENAALREHAVTLEARIRAR